MFKKNNIIKVLFILPTTLIFTYVVFMSVIGSLFYSTFKLKGFQFEEFVGLRYFYRAFTDEFFYIALKQTGIYLFFSLFVILGLALIISLLLNYMYLKKLKGYALFRKIYLIPAILPSVVVATIWLFIYHDRIGMINMTLTLIGLEQFTQTWLRNQRLILLLVSIVASWQWVGFYVMILFTSIISIPKQLYEAAYIDGIGDFKMVTKIILPVISRTLESVFILGILGSIKAFDLIWVMTRGGPLNASEVLTTFMYRQAFMRGNYEYGTAVGLVLLAICFIITFLIREFFKRRAHKF